MSDEVKILFIDQDARSGRSEWRLTLPAVPRVGEFVNLGDGTRRYVEAVVWLADPNVAHGVKIDLRRGMPSR